LAASRAAVRQRCTPAVELLTEVGVDAIVPWAAQRCVAQWRGERATAGVQRWRTAAREAAKQSRRAWLREGRELASTAEGGALLAAATQPVVLHEAAQRPISDLSMPAIGDVVVVVGPEGGLSEQELATFADHGEPVAMGPTVLRTSTAGAVAAAVLLSRTNRWSPS
jgi:16S rRNA (uracil1498-N3)-methyltransferase